MKKRLIYAILTLFTFVFLLQGCLISLPERPPSPPSPEPVEDESEIEDGEDEEENERPALIEIPSPGQFTLRFEPESYINPLVTLNRDNIVLGSLIYESLFILDEHLVAKPLLCSNWQTDDNIEFTFEILPDILMHDGEPLTANDVAYSINHASKNGRHAGKLSAISSIDTDGELTVTITLESPNARFIRLLDIPIIRSGTSASHFPPGSGPYVFPAPDAMRLVRFSGHRQFSEMPLPVINLIVCEDRELTELFDNGGLSVLWDDPTGAFDMRLNRRNEPRHYNTSALHFIGFNANSAVLGDSDVRRAIGSSIERQYIVENIMNIPNPGQTVASPVAISPIFDLYDSEWENRGIHPLVEMGALLSRAGLADYNEDGFLEVPDGLGGYRPFTLTFIVNVENAHKLAAAHRIADTLRQSGFDINLRELQWELFIATLEDGGFDMYYGETLLGADFDLSPLLLPGDLNFGRTADNAYKPFIDEFLAADTPEAVSIAGARLTMEIIQDAPFIPILYKRHAIYSPTGVIKGAFPSQSGVFNNFQDWNIDLYMLN